jgi:uncharacterized membrane protein YfcA
MGSLLYHCRMDDEPQGRTNYDWVNGLRVGILAGGLLAGLIGWAIGQLPFVWMVIGAAIGGYIGVRMARRE